MPGREEIRTIRHKPGAGLVVLDRMVTGYTPAYCIHGRVQCARCLAWCWLGDATVKAVTDGTVPLCGQCAALVLPPGAAPDGHLSDHGRDAP